MDDIDDFSEPKYEVVDIIQEDKERIILQVPKKSRYNKEDCSVVNMDKSKFTYTVKRTLSYYFAPLKYAPVTFFIYFNDNIYRAYFLCRDIKIPQLLEHPLFRDGPVKESPWKKVRFYIQWSVWRDYYILSYYNKKRYIVRGQTYFAFPEFKSGDSGFGPEIILNTSRVNEPAVYLVPNILLGRSQKSSRTYIPIDLGCFSFDEVDTSSKLYKKKMM